MVEEARGDTRARLLEATAELISASPGEEVSLREICTMVGVKMPTLYHFFGSKQGLLEAVVEHGFDLYLSQKSYVPTGDAIQDLRHGWDDHVAFGISNPGFYSLMYGKVRFGFAPGPQARPKALLLSLMKKAAGQNRLVVSAEQATSHILATMVGVTLRQIVFGKEDRQLSIEIREGAIAAITGAAPTNSTPQAEMMRALEYANAHPDVLGGPETALLSAWLQKLAQDAGSR